MGQCNVVNASVQANGVCDRWEGAQEAVQGVAGESYYVPFEKGLDDSLFFPFGVFHRGGKRKFTREDGEEMVRNFKANILQRTNGLLPINREHKGELGRLAWISDLWVAEDGVRGSLKPAPGHEEEVLGFDYLSPEIKWEWTHPYTSETHRNVLFGGALTNYPYLLGKTAVHHVWTEKGEWEEALPTPPLRGEGQAFVHEVPLGMADAEKRIVYGVVFQPDEADGEGHMLEAEDIEAACHGFMEFIQFAGAEATLDAHHRRPVVADEARIVECWIQREPVTWRFGERETQVLPGSWCMGVKILSDDLWAEVERGEITGFSPKGWGVLTVLEEYGGPGSGHWGHAGRPGQVGGSTSGRGSSYQVGITSARPGKSLDQVKAELGEFEEMMRETPAKNLSVQLGTGGWEGGSEPTFITQYDGNGEAMRKLAEAGKKWNQDAVLVMKYVESGGQPQTRFSFSEALGVIEVEGVENWLVSEGIGGWTWAKNDQGQMTLFCTCVPQWGGDADAHLSASENVLAALKGAGYNVDYGVKQVDVTVMDKGSYDDYL